MSIPAVITVTIVAPSACSWLTPLTAPVILDSAFGFCGFAFVSVCFVSNVVGSGWFSCSSCVLVCAVCIVCTSQFLFSSGFLSSFLRVQ